MKTRRRQYNGEHWCIVAATFLVLALLALGLLPGCGVPVAVIKAHQAEIEFLKQDEAAIGEKYANKVQVLEASIADLWTACEADISAYQPTPEKPLVVYALECIKGVRAAEKVLQVQIGALAAAEAQERENVDDRRKLLVKASEIVEGSQQWPEDAKQWATELREMLEGL